MNRQLGDLAATLEHRLPELEWKFSQQPRMQILWNLPRYLFQTPPGKSYSHYLNEIKKDIRLLQNEDRTPVGQQHLALKIEQKINVLIRVWRVQASQAKNTPVQTAVLQRLGKRREWLQELEASIQDLKKQLQSLEARLQQGERTQSAEWRLEIARDIGQARQQLDLQEEQYQRASSVKSKDSKPYTK